MPQLRQADLVQRRLAGVASLLLRAELPSSARRRIPRSIRSIDPIELLRLVLVIAQGAMIAVTWPLWQARTDIPNLPLIDGLPQTGVVWVLLATLVLTVARPREGIVVHVLVLAYALMADQMRLQPEWISVALLLVATGPWRHARTLGWAHLGSLWLWAGMAKLTSAGFEATSAHTVATNLGVSSLAPVLTWAIPLFEVALGVAVARTAWRSNAIGPAVLLHAGSIVVLRMGLDWEIFWWNLALVASALVLLRPERARGPRPRSGGRVSLTTQAGLRTALVVGLYLYPAGMYVGLVDPYLGYNLYAGSNPTADVCDVNGCTRYAINISGAAIGTQVPTSPRIFEAWFQSICRPGDELRITGMKLRPPLDGLDVAQPSSSTCDRG
ncbi:MAG: hypothetical protein ABI239_08210 [Aquihabitans sp.]